jgi:beta-glucosidase
VNFPYAVTPLEGLKSRLGGQMQINYAPGLIQVGDLFPIETSWFTPPSAKPGEHGLLGEYFNNKELSGSPVLTRIDPNVDFRWGAASPGPGVLADGFGDDGVRLILDGKTLFDSWGKPRITYTAEVHLEGGRPYSLRYEYYENISAATARFGWREKTGDITSAAVLAGDADPGGRLPMSWPKQWKDSAAYGKYPGEKGEVPYSEGLFVGYRHFDRAGVEPQFPFGYGLSYTQFAYSNLRVEPGTAAANQRICVSCEVQNTGTRPGSEVVQLYVRDVEASVPRPVKELKAFEKIRLKPGEQRQVTFDLGREALSFYDVSKHEWVAEPGAFEMLVGRSSRGIQLRGPFELAK